MRVAAASMVGAPTSCRWQPIEDLPTDHEGLASVELGALAAVWVEQRGSLEGSGALRRFNERLQREWAIETGIIERVYALDRGITDLLIEHGVDASLIPHFKTDKDPQLVASMIHDHEEALDSLFDLVKGNRVLSTSYIKELHALMTRHQGSTSAIDSLGRRVEVPLLRGEYKAQPNDPRRPDGTVHEYCPPEHVASEMDRLVSLHQAHEAAGVAPEVEASWAHHAFTQIHPFQDGNGRVARAIASLLFTEAGWFPLVVTDEERESYITALETADQGSLRELVDLFSSIQKRLFVQALGIAGDVLREDCVDQVIAGARDLLERRRQALSVEWERAKRGAAALQRGAKLRFEEAATKLGRELERYSPDYQFFADDEPDRGKRSFWFRGQIIETAKSLKYFADPTEYRAWARLVLETDARAEVLLSFHSIGQEFRGVLAASMCFFRREAVEGGERNVAGLTTVSDEVFQVNYKEQQAQSAKRFDEWLERGLVKALEMWRRGL